MVVSAGNIDESHGGGISIRVDHYHRFGATTTTVFETETIIGSTRKYDFVTALARAH
jgi:hypothetical protein